MTHSAEDRAKSKEEKQEVENIDTDIDAPTSQLSESNDAPTLLIPSSPPSQSSHDAPSHDTASLPRMIISKMVLTNFKSYAGKKTIGPFHKRFSSVVGPNGSGKSNVIDALLFVFGRNAKKIRLNKLVELIHGSENHRDLKSARVDIHFCEIKDQEDDDAYEKIPGSEFIISREVMRKGGSRYLINLKRCNLQDIDRLLESKGLNLHNNRFLILQGEVEQISLMKPKGKDEHDEGLLEWLEDIIGTDHYVKKIEDAEQKLGTLDEERQNVLNLVKSVEKDRARLETSKDAAEEYVRKQRTVQIKHALLAQNYKSESLFCIQKHEQKIEADKKDLITYKKEQEQGEKEVKEIESLYEAKKEEQDALKKDMDEARDSLNALEREHVQIKEKKAFEKSNVKKLRGQITRLKKQIDGCNDKLKAQEGVPDLQEQLKDASAKLEFESKKKDDMYETVKHKVEPIKLKLEKVQKELIPKEQIKNQCLQAVSVTENQINLIQQKAQDVKRQYDKANADLEDLKLSMESQSRQKDKKQEEVAEKEELIKQLQRELKKIEADEKTLGQKKQPLQSKIGDARAAIDQQKRESNVIQALMELKQNGSLPGIIGRLGSLGSIDNKFDVAASTAGGGNLNAMLVETTKVASDCFKYLRDNQIGSTRIIALDRQTQFDKRARNCPQIPRGSQRLIDLIRMKDERYRCAFYMAFRDCLVARDIDEGERFHKGGNLGGAWRVVTLQGAMYETSGVMSGGGGKPKSGLLSAQLRDDTVTAATLRGWEEELKKLDDRCAHLNAEFRQTRDRIRRATNDIDGLRVGLEMIARDVEESVLTENRLKELMKELEKSLGTSEADQQKLEELEVERKSQTDALEEARENCKSMEKECEKLKKQMMKAGGTKLKEQDEAVQQLENRTAELNSNITKIQVEGKNAERKIKSLEKDIVSKRQECDDSKAKHEQLKKEAEILITRAAKVLEGIETNQKIFDDKKEEIHKLYTSCKEKQQELDDNRNNKMICEDHIKDLRRRIVNNQSKAEQWAQELEKFKREIKESDKILEEVKSLNNLSPDKQDSEKKGFEPLQVGEDGAVAMDTSEDQNVPADEEPTEKDGDGDIAMKNTDEDDSNRECSQLDLRFDAKELLSQDKIKELELYIGDMEKKLEDMDSNLTPIKEYREKTLEYSRRVGQLNDISKKRDEMREEFDKLKKERLDLFMKDFNVISTHLKEMYRMLTQGGDAELELVDTLNPFSEGIIFSVRPPKKSWKNISNLSGGEKTLSSLALVFALHHYKPTPLYVMDEIDAALDFKNVSIVANYIKDRTKDAQFLIISLRNNMFELANRLVGIYKTNNASKSLTVNPHKFSVHVVPPAPPSGIHHLQNVPPASNRLIDFGDVQQNQRSRILRSTDSATPFSDVQNRGQSSRLIDENSKKRRAPTSVEAAEAEVEAENEVMAS